jgi:hypothetical protein
MKTPPKNKPIESTVSSNPYIETESAIKNITRNAFTGLDKINIPHYEHILIKKSIVVEAPLEYIK